MIDDDHPLPIIIAVIDCECETDHFTITAGPMDADDMDRVSSLLASEDFKENVAHEIRQAKEAVAAARLAAKAKLN